MSSLPAAIAPPRPKSVGQILGISGMFYIVLSVAGVIGKLVELAMKDPPKQLGPALTIIPILMIIVGGISINGMLSGNELKAVIALAMGFISVFFFDKIIEYTERNRTLQDSAKADAKADAAIKAQKALADAIMSGDDDEDDDDEDDDDDDDDDDDME